MDWNARFTSVTAGEVTIAPFAKENPIVVKDGMIHDWIAATVARGATVEKMLGVLQNYTNYKKIYGPDVADSRLLSHEGNVFRAYLRLVRNTPLPVALNSEYDVEYRSLNGGRWAVISRSRKIVEMDGTQELAPGTGNGFLWKLNAYWLVEPRGEGVYLECRSISLTRDIPLGLAWAIKPFVSSLPRDSLRTTLEATVRGLR